MRRAREDLLATKTAAKTAQRERDEEKDRIGKALIASAAKRKLSVSGCGSEAEEIGIARNKSKARSVRAGPSPDMAAFSSKLRYAYLAQIELDRKRLQFERERNEADREERECEKMQEL